MENKKTIGHQLFDMLDYIDHYDKGKIQEDIITFVNNLIDKWNKLDSEKLTERNSKIVIVRLINEMVKLQNEKEAENWFAVLNEISPKSPDRAMNFLKGDMYYKLHNLEQAYHFLQISYNDDSAFLTLQNKDYIDFLISYKRM